MKKILYFILFAILLVSCHKEPKETTPDYLKYYKDNIPNMPPYYATIEFAPYITREQFAMLLTQELPDVGYDDDDANDIILRWSERWVRKAMKYKIMETAPDGNFYPEDKIKRKQLAMMVMRMAAYINIIPFSVVKYDYKDIKDSDYFAKGAYIIGRYGLLPITDGNFYPNKYLTGPDAIYFVYMIKHWMVLP